MEERKAQFKITNGGEEMKVHLQHQGIFWMSCNKWLAPDNCVYTTKYEDVTCENCKRTNEYKQAKNKQREAEQMELKKELYEIINDYKKCDNCSNRIDEDHCKLKSAIRFDDEGICVDWEAKTAEPQTKSNNKYNRDCKGVKIDVYDVLKAFDVKCGALQHLIKKALCAGLRGHKTTSQDLQDIIDSAVRAKELYDEVE